MKLLDKSERKDYIPAVCIRIPTTSGTITLSLDQHQFPLELEVVSGGSIRSYTINLHIKNGEPCSATLT